ncbi:MAG: hypothetical protein HY356_08705 [Gammaproteobacteria bacterium]|nr:hypothetical protein [Gammaproteobacteria bacterium]
MAQPKDTTQHRYSDRPFPPYRFIPGKTPHPTRDTEGHSYNKPAVHLASFDPVDWPIYRIE